MAIKNKYPVPPEEFNDEIVKSKKQGRLTEKAGHLILKLVTNYQDKNKKMKYSSIDIKNDVRSVAIHIVCEKWDRFDETKYSNAFSYFTTIVERALYEGMNRYTKMTEKEDYNYDYIFNNSI